MRDRVKVLRGGPHPARSEGHPARCGGHPARRSRTIRGGGRTTARWLAVTAGMTAALTAGMAAAGCSPAGDAPEAPFRLTASHPPVADGAGMPFVAADAARFYMSWTEPTGEVGPTGRPVHAVRFATLDADAGSDAGWSAPRTLAASDRFFVNWADFPSIAAAGEGRLAAHWLLRSGDGTYDYDIVVSTSGDGGDRWSEPRVMHADGVAAEHGFLSFFPQEEGFGAVWLDGRHTVGGHGDAEESGEGHGGGGAMTLRAGLLTWDGEARDLDELDARICDCCQTGAAVTDEGVVAVYRGRTQDEIRDILAVRLVDGRWEAPAPVHDDGWQIPACPVNGPAVSAAGRRVVTAWFTGAGNEPRVSVAFSDDAGARWGPRIPVDTGAPLGRVDVELLPDGSALVVWLEATADEASIMARRVYADGRTGDAHPLALTSQVRASGFPRMTRAGDRILLAWTEPAETRGQESTVRAAWLEVASPDIR